MVLNKLLYLTVGVNPVPKNTGRPAEPVLRYITVTTRLGETAHIRISKIHRDAGYLLLDGFVEHKKGRNYLSELIFAQLYFRRDDEYHNPHRALSIIKRDCLIELKPYTDAEWSNITHQLNFAHDADNLFSKPEAPNE